MKNILFIKNLVLILTISKKEIEKLKEVVKDINSYSMYSSGIWLDFVNNSNGHIKTVEEIYNDDFECGKYGLRTHFD